MPADGYRPRQAPGGYGRHEREQRPDPEPGPTPARASEHGWVETPYPLAPFAPGETFAAQYAFRNPTTCQGPRPWSTSNGLLVTVQP